MRHYPAFLDIEGRPCLVVGGGAAALAKVRLLRRAGADVTVLARRFDADLQSLADNGEVALTKRAFRASDVASRALVHAASGVAALDEAVADAAKARNIPVNVVDGAALSSFVMPAIVDRGPLVIGISSGGASPVLARRVRAEIEMLLPHGLGRLARFAQSFRLAVHTTFADFEFRLRFWDNFFDGPLAESVLAGKEHQARSGMLALVNRAQLPPAGEIENIEVDPVQPDLLTLRDVRRIARADVIFHDGAVGTAILDHARRDARRIEADSETDQLMAAELKAGKRIVRLTARQEYGKTASPHNEGERIMKLDIVSANRLTDGRVVYLTRDDGWSESIIDGRSAATKEESADLLADAERAVEAGIVVAPYLVSMADDGGTFAPLHFRERIRLFGPKTDRATGHPVGRVA